jgi:hypothetical protein
MSEYRAKEARIAAAESDLRELGELLEASLRVECDICLRIRDGESSSRLKGQRKYYARIIGLILDAYFVAVDEFLLAVSNSGDIESANGGSNGPPPFPGGMRWTAQ